jgi:hypothetical protein
MKLRPEKVLEMLIITQFKNCHHPPLLFKTLKIKIHKTRTLPVFYHGSDMVSHFHGRVNIIIIENKALIKVSVPT